MNHCLNKLIVIMTGSLLGGCASESVKITESQHPIESHKLKSLDPAEITINTPLDPMMPLTLKQAWPLFYNEAHHGRYLQKIKTSVQNQDFTITVHLTIGLNKIEFIALNDIYGRVYDLVWTPDSITWKASEHLPKTVRPENILTDFILAHLSAENLKNSASKLSHENIRIFETESPQNRQTIIQDVCGQKSTEGKLWVIERQTPMDLFWKTVTLRNLQFGYTLEIQTVKLP